MKLGVHTERWPTRTPFRIAGRVFDAFESVVVQLEHGGSVGQGEALGVFYMGDTLERMVSQIEALRPALAAGLDRAQLQSLLPPGGARNALDAALWDLEAKASRRSIWTLSAVQPKPLETVFTIGIEATAQDMAAKAAAARDCPLLKVKLDGTEPVERMQAIRSARPDARIVVDANQGWSFEQLQAVAPAMAELGVQMIEQPLPRDHDAPLASYRSPVPLFADESCQHLGELAQAAARYQGINIKLDKAGGLTHGIELARAARGLGLGVMVGCMGGSSLAMAPSFVLGCLADLVDIDGPLLQASDRLPGLRYNGCQVEVFGAELWG
jgi:L-Ala-D/L-Glu epimerase